jgi:aspartate aminotransferase
MIPLADRTRRLTASSTLLVSARAASLRTAGHDVLSLAAGEPDFDTPPHVVAAMAAAAAAGATRYPPVLGLPALRAAVADNHALRYGVRRPAESVAITPGAKMALWATFAALVDPGTEVIVPTPCWVSYGPQIDMAGGTLVAVPCRPEAGWALDPDAIAAAITPRTVAIVLCAPNNPTGALISADAARKLGDLALEHDLWLICDDIYSELCFRPGTFESPLKDRPELDDRVIVIDGLSKSHAMTGWRLGYLSGPLPVVQTVGTLLGQTITGTTTFVQHGALAALTEPYDLTPIRAAYARRAALLSDGLIALGIPVVPPSGGFCLLADFRHRLGLFEGALATDDEVLALKLLERQFVATVAGHAFEAPGFLRFSFACADATLERALERISAFLA